MLLKFLFIYAHLSLSSVSSHLKQNKYKRTSWIKQSWPDKWINATAARRSGIRLLYQIQTQSNRDTIIEQVERTDRDQTSSTSQSFLYRDTDTAYWIASTSIKLNFDWKLALQNAITIPHAISLRNL